MKKPYEVKHLMLETKQFGEIPGNGTTDPNLLRFAQPEISKNFSNSAHGDVYKLGTSLAANPLLAGLIPRVEIGEFSGMI